MNENAILGRRVNFARRQSTNWIRFNVGGKYFLTTERAVARDPNSCLYRLIQEENESYTDDTGAILIDRDPNYFSIVLNYLRHGKLIMDKCVAAEGVLEEATYYNLAGLVRLIEERIYNTTTGAIETGRNMLNRSHENQLIHATQDDNTQTSIEYLESSLPTQRPQPQTLQNNGEASAQNMTEKSAHHKNDQGSQTRVKNPFAVRSQVTCYGSESEATPSGLDSRNHADTQDVILINDDFVQLDDSERSAVTFHTAVSSSSLRFKRIVAEDVLRASPKRRNRLYKAGPAAKAPKMTTTSKSVEVASTWAGKAPKMTTTSKSVEVASTWAGKAPKMTTTSKSVEVASTWAGKAPKMTTTSKSVEVASTWAGKAPKMTTTSKSVEVASTWAGKAPKMTTTSKSVEVASTWAGKAPKMTTTSKSVEVASTWAGKAPKMTTTSKSVEIASTWAGKAPKMTTTSKSVEVASTSAGHTHENTDAKGDAARKNKVSKRLREERKEGKWAKFIIKKSYKQLHRYCVFCRKYMTDIRSHRKKMHQNFAKSKLRRVCPRCNIAFHHAGGVMIEVHKCLAAS